MTPLAARWRGASAPAGPITVADYMAECLLHPVHGYYTTRDPLAPQAISPPRPRSARCSASLLGLCLAQAWLDRARPRPLPWPSLGPGRGTLMADVLRATRSVPGFHAAARLTLVEASPVPARAAAAGAGPGTRPDGASARHGGAGALHRLWRLGTAAATPFRPLKPPCALPIRFAAPGTADLTAHVDFAAAGRKPPRPPAPPRMHDAGCAVSGTASGSTARAQRGWRSGLTGAARLMPMSAAASPLDPSRPDGAPVQGDRADPARRAAPAGT
jgi:hypothetical protein